MRSRRPRSAVPASVSPSRGRLGMMVGGVPFTLKMWGDLESGWRSPARSAEAVNPLGFRHARLEWPTSTKAVALVAGGVLFVWAAHVARAEAPAGPQPGAQIPSWLTGLPSSRDEGEPRSRGYRGTGRPTIVDPAGNARSYFLGAGRETAHPGPDWNWTGSGRAKLARRSTARMRPAPPNQTRGPDRPQGVAPGATEAQSAEQ